MTIAVITHTDCLLHNPGKMHPECTERLQVIADQFIASGLDSILKHVDAPLVTREQLARVHTTEYMDRLFQYVPSQGQINLDSDTVMDSHTLSAALRAAGAVVKGVDLVMSNTVSSVFCNVRPPGHHAESARAMGFCFFNNVAVGVAHALAHHHLQRVAIIDFDAHQGNGTEEIFKHNKKVLVCSLYESHLYPFCDATMNAPNIIDIPLAAGATGREFRAEMVQHGLERLLDFKPELLFISAGFDGHQQDELSSLNLTEQDYFWITQQVKHIADNCCQGRIVSVLEGGYALSSLGRCVKAHLNALLA